MKKISPYGYWHSPITPEWLTRSQKKLGSIIVEGSSIYWEESRPTEQGRCVIMQRREDGTVLERIPRHASARSRVHEYGGLSFAVANSEVYYVNDKDQRIYKENEPLTEAGVRCVEPQVIGDYLVAIGEQGKDNFIFSLHLPSKTFRKIATSHDFFSSVAFSPDGRKIAYLCWNHPNMPWDSTELWKADFVNGAIISQKKVAGGAEESIFQPLWNEQGVLHFISDRTGWWNLYKIENNALQSLYPIDAEFGMPLWVFGMSTYGFCQGQVVCCCNQKGAWRLACLPPFEELSLPWTYYTQIRTYETQVVFIAASETEEKAIVTYDIKTKTYQKIVCDSSPHVPPETLSIGERISFISAQGREVHAIYYPPKNKDWQAPPETLPPLIVMSHGGPTSQTFALLDLKIQFWTSRGFAVVDVNYAGSSGYGRAYRESLKLHWGQKDVEDCEAAARYLIDQKKVDPKKIAIRGGSAGGFTTLAALTFGSVFSVGASYYGVSNLEALAEETHKFESHYLDSLVGPYPEKKEIYRHRSPLFHVDQLRCPVIFFQGAEDAVVPLNQAEMMHKALLSKGIETQLIIYPEEQHGFRKSENIKDALVKELHFYLKVWSQPDRASSSSVLNMI